MQTSKRLRVEGDAYSKLVQVVRNVGRNETSTLRFGTVISSPPELKILLDNDPIEYDKFDLYVAESLTNKSVDADIPGYGSTTIEINNELSTGDRVMVECDDESMKYIVLDRVVSYR